MKKRRKISHMRRKAKMKLIRVRSDSLNDDRDIVRSV